jgi:hypothetical protein
VLLVGKLCLAMGPLSTVASGLQVQAWRGYWWECSKVSPVLFLGDEYMDSPLCSLWCLSSSI